MDTFNSYDKQMDTHTPLKKKCIGNIMDWGLDSSTVIKLDTVFNALIAEDVLFLWIPGASKMMRMVGVIGEGVCGSDR